MQLYASINEVSITELRSGEMSLTQRHIQILHLLLLIKYVKIKNISNFFFTSSKQRHENAHTYVCTYITHEYV